MNAMKGTNHGFCILLENDLRIPENENSSPVNKTINGEMRAQLFRQFTEN